MPAAATEQRINILDPELVDQDEPKIMPATFARAYDRVQITFTPLGRRRGDKGDEKG